MNSPRAAAMPAFAAATNPPFTGRATTRTQG